MLETCCPYAHGSGFLACSERHSECCELHSEWLDLTWSVCNAKLGMMTGSECMRFFCVPLLDSRRHPEEDARLVYEARVFKVGCNVRGVRSQQGPRSPSYPRTSKAIAGCLHLFLNITYATLDKSSLVKEIVGQACAHLPCLDLQPSLLRQGRRWIRGTLSGSTSRFAFWPFWGPSFQFISL